VVPSQPWESTSGIYWQIPAIIVASKYGKMPKEKSTFTRQRKMLGGPGRLPNIKTKKKLSFGSPIYQLKFPN
jgi:hypothetical protein